MSSIDTHVTIEELTRSTSASASLEQDLVQWCAPVLAGVKPAAMFSYPYTRKTREEIAVADPYVMLLPEFMRELDRCTAQLEPYGVRVSVLAWRENSALLFIYRPELEAAVLQSPATAENLRALGYAPEDPAASLDELVNRIHAFDHIDGQRDFWDFPHEVGYFLGYPAPDVMAYVRNRGAGCTVEGTWRAYGCHKRAHMMECIFRNLADCTRAYWQLYLEGATLSQLAALGELMTINGGKQEKTEGR